MKQRLLALLICLTLALSTAVVAAGCAAKGVALAETAEQQAVGSDLSADSGTTSSNATGEAAAASTGTSGQAAAASEAQMVSYDSEEQDATWDPSTASQITLAGDSARFDGTGAAVDGSTITITAAGTYVVAGTLADGQIVVDSADEETVRLVLSGADITCSDSAPIYVKGADKVIITLADGSENTVTDGDSYALEDSLSDEPNAAIFSKDDLIINGSGSLQVTASFNDGIASKDDLKIVSGAITVDAVNDAIQGKDCIGVKSGIVRVTSGGDGLQAANDQDAEKGFIAIEGGTFVITSGTDAIQAQTTLAVSGGEFTISSGGGSANSSQEMGEAGNTFGDWGGDVPANGTRTPDDGATTDATTAGSAKALKAGSGIFVTGGTFAVDSSDDSINSNGDVVIAGGAMQISSGDDGIHADGPLTINSGEVTLTRSYEGLEASVVTINGGTIRVTASDDGVNVAGGADSSSVSGRPGQNGFAANGDNKLTITGGYLAIDSGGDGVDCNGTITMTGGTAIVNGPIEDMNGALDAQVLTMSGGFLIAVGSAGMAEAPSDTSAQYSFMVVFDQAQAAGTLVHVESENGEDVLTFAPSKQFQAAVLSSADLNKGETYTVYLGGTATGTITDGVYSGGAYTPGAENVSLTLDAVVTISGSAGGPGMRGPGH